MGSVKCRRRLLEGEKLHSINDNILVAIIGDIKSRSQLSTRS